MKIKCLFSIVLSILLKCEKALTTVKIFIFCNILIFLILSKKRLISILFEWWKQLYSIVVITVYQYKCYVNKGFFVLEYSDLAYTSFNYRKEMKTKRLGLEVLCVIMTRMNIFSSKQKTILIITTQNRIYRYKLLHLPSSSLHSNPIMIKELN